MATGWAVVNGLKVLLDVASGGAGAAIRGVLFSLAPYPIGPALELGETLWLILDLNGSSRGKVRLRDSQRTSLSGLEIRNLQQFKNSIANLDFPGLARMEIQRMVKPELKKPNFSRMTRMED